MVKNGPNRHASADGSSLGPVIGSHESRLHQQLPSLTGAAGPLKT
jgi:hypothetical protein